MKILYYDCFCGISGDMNLAALIDLGVPKEYLLEELTKLNLNSEFKINIEKSAKLGITGTRVDVLLNNNTQMPEEALSNNKHEHTHVHDHFNTNEHSHTYEPGHIHEHNHTHEHEHTHEHDESNHHHNDSHSEHSHNHEHHHRNLKDIEDIINSSDLSDKVKNLVWICL